VNIPYVHPLDVAKNAAFGPPDATEYDAPDLGLVGAVAFQAEAFDNRPTPKRGHIVAGQLPMDPQGVPLGRSWWVSFQAPVQRCIGDSRQVWCAAELPLRVLRVRCVLMVSAHVKVTGVASFSVGDWRVATREYTFEQGAIEFVRPLPRGSRITIHLDTDPGAK